MGQGELFGVHWGDVDFDERCIDVRRQMVEVRGKPTVGELKTKRSRRRVSLPEVAVRALESHRTRLGALPMPGNLVFCTRVGTPLTKQNFRLREWLPLLKSAGLGPMPFHALRHTTATLLLHQGVSPRVVQERLGHASVGITLDLYSHVTPGLQREAANRLDELLG